MILTFEDSYLEEKFLKAENYLFDKENLLTIYYNNYDCNTFDELNQNFLKGISGKSIVYCIWAGNEDKLLPKYVGHVAGKYSRQRMRNHLAKKHKRTGAQLDNTNIALASKENIAVSYIAIEPHYMRKALEDWIIDKRRDDLIWNKIGKNKT